MHNTAFDHFENKIILFSGGRIQKTAVRDSLFIEEVKGLGLLRWELRKGATPLYQAAWGVVLDVGLRLCLLHRGHAGGGAEESAEAVKVKESQRKTEWRAKRKAGEGHRPTRHPRNHDKYDCDMKHANSCLDCN